jgi:predicted metal-dependent hydrolase
MRIHPDGSVRVTHPWFSSQKEVAAFIQLNTNWIKEHQQKVVARKVFYQFNQEIKTHNHTVSILPSTNEKQKAGVLKDKVVIAIPESSNIESDEVQHFIQMVITRICRNEAKAYLPMRVKELATQYGFIYQTVFIKKLKSKWGSCSSVGNINLNLSLMLLPDHLIDYIILHELAHTREHNHGAGFWKLLDEITNGKAHQLDKEMKNKRC